MNGSPFKVCPLLTCDTETNKKSFGIFHKRLAKASLVYSALVYSGALVLLYIL